MQATRQRRVPFPVLAATTESIVLEQGPAKYMIVSPHRQTGIGKRSAVGWVNSRPRPR